MYRYVSGYILVVIFVLKHNFFCVISVEHLKAGPPVQKTPRQLKPKVFVANGNDVPLKGTGLLFIKTGEPSAVITEQNMVKVGDCFVVYAN